MPQLRAQFATDCPDCSDPIAVGAAIRRTGHGWVHQDCGRADVQPVETQASPQRQVIAQRAGELAQALMQRAAAGVPMPSWPDQLPTNVRSVECQGCTSQNLEFQASRQGFPHWDVICRVCGEVGSFPSRPLRSGSQGRGW